MKLGKILGLVVLTGVVGVVIVGGCVYSGYNKAVGLDEAVKNAWAKVDSKLQRRFDLIPNLEATVKGLAQQEKDVFLGVAEARKAYTQAQSVADKAKAASGFESALARLLVIQERYPDLRSNQAFLSLMDSLEGSENRISVERDRYNDAVTRLNTFVRGPLGGFYARLAGVEKAERFEAAAAAREAPKVDFTGKPADES